MSGALRFNSTGQFFDALFGSNYDGHVVDFRRYQKITRDLAAYRTASDDLLQWVRNGGMRRQP